MKLENNRAGQLKECKVVMNAGNDTIGHTVLKNNQEDGGNLPLKNY